MLRPTDQTSKLTMKIRPTEGQAGDITLFIVPHADPCSFRVLKHQLPPLSLHIQSSAAEDGRPWSELKISGPFSAGDIQAWLSACLDGSGARGMAGLAHVAGERSLCFQNVILGTQLLVRFGDGYGSFQSDNLTSLAILRERLTDEASKAGLRGLNIQVRRANGTGPSFARAVALALAACLSLPYLHCLLCPGNLPACLPACRSSRSAPLARLPAGPCPARLGASRADPAVATAVSAP